MRHNNSRRSRNKGRSNNGGQNNRPNRMQVFDSNGPEVRIRGTAQQVAEKYEALAKDATSSDDMIMAQNYLQHAEHYRRILNSFHEAEERQRQEKEEELGLPDSMVKPANADASDKESEKELESA